MRLYYFYFLRFNISTLSFFLPHIIIIIIIIITPIIIITTITIIIILLLLYFITTLNSYSFLYTFTLNVIINIYFFKKKHKSGHKSRTVNRF